ncbi:MAG: hypothetical protein AB1847_05455 [bacterium]
MAKVVDFSGASKRHYHDAELLLTNSRIPNAGHLFGFAAECGIKALLVSYGLQVDKTTGDIIEKKPFKYKTHINVLINNVQTFPGSPAYFQYVQMMPKLMAFSNWHTSHRYHEESSIPGSHNNWHEAAKEVIKMLDQALADGVIV